MFAQQPFQMGLFFLGGGGGGLYVQYGSWGLTLSHFCLNNEFSLAEFCKFWNYVYV